MIKHIGNTTGYKSKQKESDPVKEKLRLQLIDSFRKEKLKRNIKKNIGEISGKIPISKSILYLFDKAGNPPPNVPIESIIKQQNYLSSQIDWLMALSNVFNKELQSLDAKRYQKDRFERKRTEEREKQQRRKSNIYNEAVDKDSKGAQLRESLREATQSDYRARKLKRYLNMDDIDDCIFPIEQIEAGIRLVFSEYIDDKSFSEMSVESQYELVKNRLSWLEVLTAEICSKLTKLMEIGEAALSFMEIES